MDKQTLRAELMRARREHSEATTEAQRYARAQGIAVLGVDLVARHRTTGTPCVVASYDALPTEPPTSELNAMLERAGVQVLLPVHQSEGQFLDQMRWTDLTTGNVVAESNSDFVELNAIVVFTPALAAGRDNTRIGKGKGFYDRFFGELPRYPLGPLRVAVVGPTEVFESVPTDPHDQPIDTVLTG